MPCNAYGINDNYNQNSSHFLPALIRKIITAIKNNDHKIKIWGSGKPLREVILSDDIADACLYFLNKNTKESLINIGSGVEKSIEEYAKFIMNYLQLKFEIKYEKKNLDGTYRKLLDSSLANKYGWKAKTSLKNGIGLAINDFLKKKIQDKI